MRRMERLVETLGIIRLSRSQVSAMAKDPRRHVEAFRTRPLDAGPYTFVAAEALVLKVREGGRKVNVHASRGWCERRRLPGDPQPACLGGGRRRRRARLADPWTPPGTGRRCPAHRGSGAKRTTPRTLVTRTTARWRTGAMRPTETRLPRRDLAWRHITMARVVGLPHASYRCGAQAKRLLHLRAARFLTKVDLSTGRLYAPTDLAAFMESMVMPGRGRLEDWR